MLLLITQPLQHLEIDWAVDLLPNRRAGFIAHAHQRGRDRTGVPVATTPHAAMILIGEHPDCPKRSTAYVDFEIMARAGEYDSPLFGLKVR